MDNYNQPYIVIGVGRSGTSAVAGMMYYLGFDMGDDFVEGTENNPAGHWEDKFFNQINNAYKQNRLRKDKFIEYINTKIDEKATQERFWGWKEPTTAELLDTYLQVCNPKLIWCKRPKDQIIDSMKRAYGWGDTRAKNLYRRRYNKIEKYFESDLWTDEGLVIRFKNVMNDPESVVEKLINYSGIKPYADQKKRAINHISQDKHEDAKVLVTVHNLGEVNREVSKQMEKISQDDRYEVDIKYPSKTPYYINVNSSLNNIFLEGDYTHWLTVDVDNPPLRNPLDLIELDKDIIGCVTPQFDGDMIFPVAMYKTYNDEYKVIPAEKQVSLQQVDAIGSGCMLTKREVVEAVKDDDEGIIWKQTPDEDGTSKRTGDFNFCDRARDLGFEVWAHFDYDCDHIKTHSLNDILEYANKKQTGGPSKYYKPKPTNEL